MKKILLSGVIMLFLMSFTSKKEIESQKEEIFSPECFETANNLANAHQISYPNSSYEANHAVFEYWYDFCEYFENNDEFQFPPL